MNLKERFSNRSKFNSPKIIASIFTISIIALLIISGPANAFILGLTVDSESQVDKGENIDFTATLTIKAVDEYLPIKQLTLNLDGPVNKQCVFDIEGNPISGCTGMTISQIDVSSYYGYGYGYGSNYGYGYNFGYGYGYGYEYGAGGGEINFEYKITLDTQYYLPGEYTTQLSTLIDDKTFSKSGENIIINGVAEDTDSEIYSGTENTLTFAKTNTTLEIKTKSNVSGKITINKYSTIPGKASGFTLPALGKFIEIDADSEISNNLNEVTIMISYTDAEVSAAGIEESTLRLYYYNETDNSWQIYDSPNGGVDTTANYVWAITDHFSLWGLFGDPIVTSTSSSGGSSCNRIAWKCTDWSDCVDGTQTRTCIKNSNVCNRFLDDEALVERVCGTNIEEEPELIDLGDTGQEGEETKGFVSRITGAVIGGVTSTTGIITIIFVVGLAGTFGIVRSIRKRRNDKKGKAKVALFVLVGLLVLNTALFIYLI